MTMKKEFGTAANNTDYLNSRFTDEITRDELEDAISRYGGDPMSEQFIDPHNITTPISIISIQTK
jgi:hypothetical protein